MDSERSALVQIQAPHVGRWSFIKSATRNLPSNYMV